MAELIIFVDTDFGGLHTHIFGTTPRSTQLALGGVGSGINGNWNDKVSSFVIVSGTWQFFKDENFNSPQGNLEGFVLAITLRSLPSASTMTHYPR